MDEKYVFDLGADGGKVQIACLGRYGKHGGPNLVLNDVNGNLKFNLSEDPNYLDVKEGFGWRTHPNTILYNPDTGLPDWFLDKEIGRTFGIVSFPTKDVGEKEYRDIHVDLKHILPYLTEGKNYIKECINEYNVKLEKNTNRFRDLDEITKTLEYENYEDVDFGE